MLRRGKGILGGWTSFDRKQIDLSKENLYTKKHKKY